MWTFIGWDEIDLYDVICQWVWAGMLVSIDWEGIVLYTVVCWWVFKAEMIVGEYFSLVCYGLSVGRGWWTMVCGRPKGRSG